MIAGFLVEQFPVTRAVYGLHATASTPASAGALRRAARLAIGRQGRGGGDRPAARARDSPPFPS